MSVLVIENLHVSFATDGGRLHALRDVSFEVAEQSIVGIVGESGCGKSTLINAILGLLADNGQIDSGSIHFLNNDLATCGESTLRDLRGTRISTVFQDPMGSLNPVLSIGKQMHNIQYRSTLNRREKQTRSIDMLKKVRIPDPQRALRQYPHELSGGMKQRIAIAMALLMKPALLIADEPTTALDATLEVAIIELLKELQQDIGCSILFVSHHLGVIAELCDRVVVMYAGSVCETGSVQQIFYQPKHPYTQRLLACDPARTSKDESHDHTQQPFATIAGELPDLTQQVTSCIFANRCDQRIAACDSPPPLLSVNTGHSVRCIRAVEL